ncbi:siderophore-interacting protein [Cellulomonas dongxiuzhuiae]|uniref:Siderophore-interacting protein n=1 Tax=Cellulomonas dongxiuzhuiae TaxID=2819979 RepID=A0ABX8GLU3_9CELL|nr:siderophore-interacting protein [Cellulomonas dongxiuzhuiae]MBO3096507.1 siderophore-interacting protein [Cellulomonas dongxiuzhuiae]QWC16900.1 siderophore-interacting protein [Cellulomonas dongxiuzhuiae]
MSTTGPSVLPPAPRRPAPVLAEVVRTARLTPHLVRVVLGGPGLDAFATPPCADSYVKLGFLPAGALDDCPSAPDGRVDLPALQATLPAGVQVRQRAYTVRTWDDATRELTLDVVVHGDEGLAGPWAAAAQPGDRVLVHGPGGAWDPRTDVDAHLLVGDASALPAVAVALERLPADAVGAAFVEVHGPDDELDLTGPAGVEVHWLHHGERPVGSTLPDAVRAWPWPVGRVGAFVHGEAGAVKELRAHLRVDHRVARGDLSISGYWRLGADDEGWRADKRAWNAQIEQAEAAAGLD